MDLSNVSNQRRWSIVGLLFTASVINYLDRAAISFALPLISQDFHLTPETKGLLLSSFFWSYALMQVPIGWCADRFNLRWLYAGAFTAVVVGAGADGAGRQSGSADRVPHSSRRRRVDLPSRRDKDCHRAVQQKRARPAFRLIRFRHAKRVGPRRHPCSLAPRALRLASHISSFGLYRSALDYPVALGFPRRMRPPNAAATSLPAATSSPIRWRALCNGSLLNRNLLGICLGFFCFDYYWYVLVTWLPDYLVTVRHLSVVQAGFYASLAFFTFGVAEPIGGWIADSLIRRGWDETRTRKGIVTGAFFMGLFLIAAMRASSTPMAIGLLIGASLVGLATGNLADHPAVLRAI